MGKVFDFLQFYKKKIKEDSLSASLKRVILGIVLVALISFVVALYVVVQKERIEYTKSESESVIKTLSNNIFSEIKNYT